MLQAGTVDVWCEGSGLERMNVSAGEMWTYLQYRAEGSVTARIQGKVCEVPALIDEKIFGETLPQPVVQWWVKVLHADGSSPG